MLYDTLKRLLFLLDPETAHSVIASNVGWATHLGLNRLLCDLPPEDPVTVMGVRFPNTIGLAAGFDKNADLVTPLGAMGFGHIEVGTTTPLAQPGNPRPRCFRIVEHQAIINRMGFNNVGVEGILKNLEKAAPYRLRGGIVGINIGKNARTPIADAASDYVKCMNTAYNAADYLAVNISSPNTKNLRDLQSEENFDSLLTTLIETRKALMDRYEKKVPIAVKLAPDLTNEDVLRCVDALMAHGIDGVIATNTTLARPGLDGVAVAQETGGLSGTPLRVRSTEVVRLIAEHTKGEFPILASGGIMTPADALEKIQAGASVVQLFTGFIYRGPELITESVKQIAQYRRTLKENASKA